MNGFLGGCIRVLRGLDRWMGRLMHGWQDKRTIEWLEGRLN